MSEGELGANVLLPTSRSAKKEGGTKKRDSLKTAMKQSISDYDHSLTKSYEAAQKKKRAGKGCTTRTTIATINPPLLFLTNMVQT
jgi:peroxiredoxin